MIAKITKGDYLKRLDNIKQWQEKDVFKEESVSQHSYKVTIFTRVLLEEIFSNDKSFEVLVFKLDCVTLAMLHDWDESLIRRDLSHDTKYNKFNGQNVRKVLNNLSEHLANKEFGIYNDKLQYTATSSMMIDNIVEPDKDVKMFVKLCDWLALRFYVEREISLGNKAFIETLEYCNLSISDLSTKLAKRLKDKFSEFSLNFKSFIKL